MGDSVARFLYSALLALVNGTDPAPGWPTHRVSEGTCMASVVVNGRRQHYGYYHPGCTLRWKGVCTDDAGAQNSMGACVLDYRVAGSQGTRLTFVWQSMLRGYMRFKLRQRLVALVAGAGGRAPDLLVASIGHWDYMYPNDETCPNGAHCCPGLQLGLHDLHASTNATLKLWHGHFWCPACTREPPLSPLGYGCAHWGGGTLRGLQAKTADACGADLAAAEDYEYLDVQHLTTSEPQGIVGSPCGLGHHFGVLADAQALVFASLLQRAIREKQHGHYGSGKKQHGSYSTDAMRDDAERTFGPWVAKKLNLAGKLVSCASDSPCALPPATAGELAEQDEILRSSQRLEAWQHAGYCAPLGRGSGRGRSNCSSTLEGSWSAKANNITSVAACVAKCQGCPNCRYISFSRAKSHDDCSWYQRCDLSALIPPPTTGLDYSTVQVKGRDELKTRAWTGKQRAERLNGAAES